ncbi:MAG TPA: UxaA family hydrolase [Fimbriimonadaceae bacterium]|nr:UxaA family hydrolase [Fimbriimonadaceae bacterium]
MRTDELPGTTRRCFKVHEGDNVATMLDEATPGALTILGQTQGLDLREPVGLGHKIALRTIAAGEPILKFGVPIGHASIDIEAGAWVHLHNCRSNYDERSQTLDLHTGAATDTAYG